MADGKPLIVTVRVARKSAGGKFQMDKAFFSFVEREFVLSSIHGLLVESNTVECLFTINQESRVIHWDNDMIEGIVCILDWHYLVAL